MITWNPSSDINMQTILVISKDEEALNVWSAFFKEKKYQAISESDIHKGLQTARLLTPLLIILDLDLTQNESLEFCQKLRSTTNGAFIALAPQNSEPDISNYYQAGVDELIFKPVNPMAVLIKAITRLARQEWILPRKEAPQVNV